MADVLSFPAGEPDPERLPVPADVSYEVAIDAEPDLSPVLVDPVPAEGVLLPVIPANLQTLEGVKAELVRHAGRQLHRVKYHGVRSPKYLYLTAVWAVAGTVVLVYRWLHWWLMPVPASVHADAVAEGHRAWKGVFKTHTETTKRRAIISAVIAAPVLAALAWLWVAQRWALIPLAVMVALILARYGHPRDKPIVHPATVTPRFRKLTADIVLRAYYSTGRLGHPDKPDQQITFGSTMARDGDGTRVLVDLPYGKTLKDAIDAKDSIASGLDVQVSQVFLHRDPTSTRRHVLWVADRDPLAVPVGRTPLLACKRTDIWKPAPMGLDERGQLVAVPLIWNSVLISALPRAGKTFSARLLALYAALDPHVKLSVFDAKGSPDWRKFALVADSFAFGLTPTKYGLPGDILLATLNEIKADVQDRYHRLSELPVDVCPEGKLTRKIARDPRFGMPVRLVVLEEFQEYFDIGDGPVSKEIAALLVFLVKVAPGAGVILLDATQRPSGVGSGQVAQQFTSFRDNHAIRFGLRTSSWQVSELCLGAGAYSEGLDTSTLLPQYKGVGILRGATDASPTVRTYLADGQDAERILLAARGLREQAGTLSGMAAGEEVTVPARDVLGDVLAVFGGDPGLHWQVLAARLAARFPERWEDATAEAVSAECRALGVPSVDVKMFGRGLKGCRRADAERVSAQ